MIKKFFSLLLTLCMVLAMMPAMSVRAEETHTHCVCGATSCSGSEHNNSQTWRAWNEIASLPSSEGYYYLTGDVTIASTWSPADGTVLCLNGHTITGKGTSIISVGGGTFTLTNCKNEGSVKHAEGESGKGVENAGTFNMYGGKITNNKADSSGSSGSGVRNIATFNMYGGTIANNTAKYLGGGVGNFGTFNMYGGEIFNNKAGSHGGGVDNEGTFNMYGGEISNNKADSNGGGVRNDRSATFTMQGGEISNNKAGSHGGGVNYLGGSFNVSGNVKITGNTNQSNASSNLYLGSNQTITIESPLTVGASIGVTVKDSPTEGNPVVITSAGSSDHSSFFFSDSSNYQVYNDNNTVKLRVQSGSPAGHTHCICGATHSSVGDHITQENTMFTAWESNNSLPLSSGCYYLTQDVTVDEQWQPADGTVLCLNGHTITENIWYSENTINVQSSVYFTLTDCANSNAQGKIISSEAHSAVSISSGGFFTMYGGNISEGTDLRVAVVEVIGSYTMNGGSISGNKNDLDRVPSGDLARGVHVENDGKFIMYDGNISKNEFSFTGAGVCNEGEFIMHGGSITQNVSWWNGFDGGTGGGVYNKGKFTMNGGSITGNTAKKFEDQVNNTELGGGVYNKGEFTMNGGSITGNSASQGGGVYNYGTFKVSGTPIIKDNKQDETNNIDNLYLCSGKTIDNANDLSGGAHIGVTVENPPTGGNHVIIVNTVSTDYSSFFKSDNTSYQIEFDSADSKLKMKVQPCSHTGVKVEGKAATCTEKGYKEYFQCSKCNGYFKEIACSTPISDISAWKNGEGAIPALGHGWTYSANGATLTASCSRKSVCHVGDQTLTLTAATVSHTGNEYSGATLSNQTAWTSAGLTPLTIQYEGVDGTRYSSSSTAPSAAGRYKATITAGGATAIAPFAITGAEHTLKVESGANGTAGIQGQVVTSAAIGCYADVTLTATPNNGYRLKQWVVSGSSITITNNKFIMPDGDVTVTAEFEIIPAGGGGGISGDGSSTPSTDKDNDSKTETTTLPDGTKVETSTTTDKTTGATIVEEKKTALDGTVTETKTTTQKDGSSETTSLETRTDGSTTETNTTVDTEGTEQSVVRDKDFPTGDVLTIRKTEEPSGEVSYVLATLVTEEATIVKAKVERAEALANMKNIPYRVKVLDENGKLDYKVRVNTGDVKANQTLYVYKYDSKTKSFGLVQADYQKVKADEKANIICDFENLISTQRYQLVTKSKAGLLDKKILATVKVKIGQKSLKVNQSTSFKLDEKLNLENVSTIKYSTSDKQVVKVSKAGKITGKNTGTADIKATITLINGKTKTVRMKIKVK